MYSNENINTYEHEHLSNNQLLAIVCNGSGLLRTVFIPDILYHCCSCDDDCSDIGFGACKALVLYETCMSALLTFLALRRDSF